MHCCCVLPLWHNDVGVLWLCCTFLNNLLTYKFGLGFNICRTEFQFTRYVICKCKHIQQHYKQKNIGGQFFWTTLYIVLRDLCSCNGLRQPTCLQPDHSPPNRDVYIRAKGGIGGGNWKTLHLVFTMLLDYNQCFSNVTNTHCTAASQPSRASRRRLHGLV